jgi:hypothetical protein
MSETNCQTDDYSAGLRNKARARGARRMVSQGLTLYYQSLVHKVHEDTPSFVEDVLKRASSVDRQSH